MGFRSDPLGFGRAGFFVSSGGRGGRRGSEEGLGWHCLRRFDQVREMLTAMSGNLRKGG
jgi:hypothetical protein